MSSKYYQSKLALVMVSLFCVVSSAGWKSVETHAANAQKPTVNTATARSGKPQSAVTKPKSLPVAAAGKPFPTRLQPKKIRLKIDVPCRAWVPKNSQPKAVLLCVHGLGLNSEAYKEFGEQMQADGIGTFAVDVRGFGTWIKLKGKAKCDFKSCLSDVEQALVVLHTAYPTKPIFVLGESMGGAIAMRVTAEHPELVDGLISCVPSGDRFHKAKNQLQVALRLVTLRANKPMDVGTKFIDEATDDPLLREKWKEDPLNRLALTPRELMQFQGFMNENHRTARKINETPVLMMVGLNDKLVKPEGTVELYEEIASADKTLVQVKSAEHLIFEEHRVSPQVRKVVCDWVLKHPKMQTAGK